MSSRISVLKTYKLYINGEFPRSESGRSYSLSNARGKTIANVCQSSRKDFRNAVTAARNAQAKWAARSGYNRGQILYRLAEHVEGRRQQFTEELRREGMKPKPAEAEIDHTIDRLVYYAGWADKYVQIFSTVNPVVSSHFVFSVPEPTGVVSILQGAGQGLLSLVSLICPVILGGNTVIFLADDQHPLSAITFSEVLAAGDVPPGVVNILTGYRSELVVHMASHMDVNAIIYAGNDVEEKKLVQAESSRNLKRVSFAPTAGFEEKEWEDPRLILHTQEIKTTWHPIGM